MKKISELREVFNDAINYSQRHNKDFFEKLFLRTEELENLLNPNVYFLIGEKGTGKTAYAVYLANNDYKETLSDICYIGTTDYSKFITLKREKNLQLSDFKSIWKVILLLIIAERLIKFAEKYNLPLSKEVQAIEEAVKEYYASAFSPEIQYAIQFAQNSEQAAEIISKYFNLKVSQGQQQSFSETRYQVNLLFIENKIKDALKTFKHDKNFIIFLDGIDIRPPSIRFPDYIECIQGLGEAAWELNTDFLTNIKGSRGKAKIVLLLRPDVFAKLGLQNENSKVRDNSVILNWATNRDVCYDSSFFKICDNMLFCQQDHFNVEGKSWNHYFPFQEYSRDSRPIGSFPKFLDITWHRPRDIATIISILRENRKSDQGLSDIHFEERELNSPVFTRKFADYMLGEVKDYAAFFLIKKNIEDVLYFFQFLDGKKLFNYDTFKTAFQHYKAWLNSQDKLKIPQLSTPDNFLQLLYEMNIICYRVDASDEHFWHWCYRERTLAELFPKIKVNSTYQVHTSIAKVLDIGKRVASIKVETRQATKKQAPSASGGSPSHPRDLNTNRENSQRPNRDTATGGSTPSPKRDKRKFWGRRRPK